MLPALEDGPKTDRQQLAPLESEVVLGLYRGGWRPTRIAELLGRAHSTIVAHIDRFPDSRSNAPDRQGYQRRANPVRPFTAEEDLEILRLLDAGHSRRFIARQLGRHHQVVGERAATLLERQERDQRFTTRLRRMLAGPDYRMASPG